MTRGTAGHDGQTWAILSDDSVNALGFHTVDNVVTGPGYEKAVGIDLNILLWKSK
jgi:hypothetical protein